MTVADYRTARFGAGLLGHTSAANGLDRVLEAAAVCEQAGMDSFWVADQRWMRDVYVTLGALAASTHRIQLGTRVTDPYIRHPALTAVALATLDEASGGRAVLGMGAGGSGFAQLGLRREHPATAIREAVALIRQLWRGQQAEFHGQLIDWAGGGLEFRCRPDIPVVIAARGPRLLELAGEIADGAIVAAGRPIADAHPDWPVFRVGVNTGPAVVGNVGSDARRSFAAIGDAINTAARLMAAGELGEVVVGKATWDALGAQQTGEPLGAVRVKGKTAPVEAWRLREPPLS